MAPSTLDEKMVKFGPRTKKLLTWILTHRSAHFSGDCISALKGLLRPEILTCARDWPKVPSAHTQLGQGSPKNFNSENLKFGLKFSVCTSITSGLMGISSHIFIQTSCSEPGLIMWVQFLDGLPPKIWEGEKSVQNPARFLTTFNFDREYLRNGSTYRKLKK